MNILVFAGTSEGRLLAEFLSQISQAATICVATEYGELVLPPLPYIQVHQGRLTSAQMQQMMAPDTLVIDATHPYAAVVTENIQQAATQAGVQYIRLVRESLSYGKHVIVVPDTQAAAAYLNSVTGTALLTTGSKELEAFTGVAQFAKRLWPRVLPTPSVLEKCITLGFAPAHIIAMQGPFSKAMNVALLKQTSAKYLVTKDTGAAGGFSEKIEAAQQVGAQVILIARPTQEQGMTLAQVKRQLQVQSPTENIPTPNSRFPLFVSLVGKKCVVVGAGRIGKRRAQMLRQFGAQVHIIAPVACEIEPTAYEYYHKADIEDAFLVVAATNIRETNHAIAQDCKDSGIFCAVADSSEESTFFFPAVCQSGKLVAGVVSDGSEHALTAKAAQQIRQVLQHTTQEDEDADDYRGQP